MQKKVLKITLMLSVLCIHVIGQRYIKFMAVGDSKTQGDNFLGWRDALYTKLQTAGYFFTPQGNYGNQAGNVGGVPPLNATCGTAWGNDIGANGSGYTGSWPIDFEGHGGFQAGKSCTTTGYTDHSLAQMIDTDIPRFNPEVVTIDLGTNDILGGWTQHGPWSTDGTWTGRAIAASQNVLAVADQIHALLPNAYILISEIGRAAAGMSATLEEVGPYLQAGVNSRIALGWKIQYVGNIYADLLTSDVDPDHVHPLRSGYLKMADRWFTAIKPVFDQVLAGNAAPSVSITSPANNASFTAPASITINATATDADGTISKVDFYNGTTLLGTDNTSPFSYTWSNVAAGTYNLTAKATDNLNAVTSSAVISVTVSGGTTSGLVSYVPLNEPGSGGRITSLAISPFNGNKILLGGDMLGIGLSDDNGATWKPTFGLTGYEIADFTFHPTNGSEIWVGTMSGPFKSTDGGTNWTAKRSGMDAVNGSNYSCPIQKIIFDPANSSHLMAFGGSHREWSSNGSPKWNAVWNSTNGGDTWTLVTTIGTASAPGIMAAAYIGTNKIALASNGNGVYISTNNGSTWTASNTGLPNNGILWLEVNQTNKNIMYAGMAATASVAGAIYKSTNNGASWAISSTGLQINTNANLNLASNYKQLSVSSANQNVIYTSNNAYNPAGIFKSIDGGANWTTVGASNLNVTMASSIFFNSPGPSMTVVTTSPTDANVCWVGGSEYLLRTTDGGATWKDMLSAPTGTGNTFTGNGFSGLVARGIKFNPYKSGECALLSMDDGKFMFSRDNLATWKKSGNGMDPWNGSNDAAFAGTNGSTIYLTTGQAGNFEGVAISTDNGANWITKDFTFFSGTTHYGGGNPYGVYALPTNPNTAWVVVQDKVFKTINGGTSWAQVFTSPGLKFIAAKPSTPSTFYINGDNGIYQTTDGSNFTLMSGSPVRANTIHIDPNNENNLFCTVFKTGNSSVQGAWKYVSGTWTRIFTDGNSADIAIQPGNSNFLIVALSEDPYKDYTSQDMFMISQDGGATWTNNIVGLPMIRANVIAFNPFNGSQFIIGLNGRGFYKGSISGGSTVAVTGVTVSPTTASITAGSTQQLTATITPSNATNQTVAWTSSNTSVATVSSSGLVTGVAAGTATLTVTTQDGSKTATCAVTVTAGSSTNIGNTTLLSATDNGNSTCFHSIRITTTQSLTLNSLSIYCQAAGGNVILALYDDLSNKPNVLKAQTAAFTPVAGQWNTQSVQTSVTLAAGNYWIAFQTNNNAFTTNYSSTGGVSYSNCSHTYGTVDATFPTGTLSNRMWNVYGTFSSSSTVAVTGVTVSPTTASITAGSTQQLTATITPSNATNQTVAWTSSNTSVATVSSSGLVTGVAAGTATITVTTQDGSKTATCAVTVTSGASSGTGAVWSNMTNSTSDLTYSAQPGISDGNLTADVAVSSASASGNWQAAGILWSSAQSNITTVKFYNGSCPSIPQDGIFSANMKLQQSTNGSTWTDVSGWSLAPAYPYTEAASNVTYTFTGPAINSVKGIRVVGQVRINASYFIRVKEVQVISGTGGLLRMGNSLQVNSPVFNIRVYPNPVSSLKIAVHLAGSKNTLVNLSITDISGRVLYNTFAVPSSDSEYKAVFDKASLSKGTYILLANSKNGNRAVKFIVQ